MLTDIEVSEICKHLGESTPKNIKRVHGGQIHQSWKLEFNNKDIFVKVNSTNKPFLAYEKFCILDLQKYINNNNLIVPKVIKYIKSNMSEILIMEWLDMEGISQKKLGRGLAEMHILSQESQPDKFGYAVEGFIGRSKQISGWERTWVDCFINLRLEPQLLLLKKNVFTLDIINKIKSSIYKQLYIHNPKSSIVHGDLWSGNMGIHKSEKGIIFDPACWWADSEVDLAMTRLFGGYSNEFYEEYNKVIPPIKGHEKRAIIYNFYHILNHANMFGGTYLTEVRVYANKILEM